MKNTLSIALLVVAGSLAPATASHAQTVKLSAKIPFAFSSGRTNLPAGVYQVSTVGQTPFITLADSQNHRSMLLARAQPAKSNNGSKLIFHKCGSHYFLSAVYNGGRAPDVELPVTKAEKRARHQTEEAGLRVEDPILIAMN